MISIGISRNKEIYTEKFFDGLKDIPALTFTAEIEMWDRSAETAVYDPVANAYSVTYTPSTAQPLPCRVQPMRSAVQRFTANDGTWAAHVLISMHRDNRFDVEAGSRAKIVSASSNQSLLSKFLTVKEIMDSDNSIEFTILCEVDTELHEQG